ncbi:LexA family transcriptional regulator [Planctomycetota bacterium]
MAGFTERLAGIREEAFGKRGKSAFARALGIPLTSYLNFENGRVPPMDTIVKMMALTRVNPRWLVHGKGSRHLPEEIGPSLAEDAASLLSALLEENARLREEQLAAKRAGQPAVLVVPADADPEVWPAAQEGVRAAAEEHIAVPVLSCQAAANPPGNVFEADNDGWLLCPSSAVKHPKSTFAMRVGDGAMAPTIPQGSLVGVDCSVRDPAKLHKSGSRLVAVRDPRQGCCIRQLEKAEGHWLFLPTNMSEQAMPMVWTEGSREQCLIIGKVVFVFATP